jgi:hypothetical protein
MATIALVPGARDYGYDGRAYTYDCRQHISRQRRYRRTGTYSGEQLDSDLGLYYLRANCYSQRMDSFDELVRTSVVVLAELWRGAATTAEQTFLRTLERKYLS